MAPKAKQHSVRNEPFSEFREGAGNTVEGVSRRPIKYVLAKRPQNARGGGPRPRFHAELDSAAGIAHFSWDMETKHLCHKVPKTECEYLDLRAMPITLGGEIKRKNTARKGATVAPKKSGGTDRKHA